MPYVGAGLPVPQYNNNKLPEPYTNPTLAPIAILSRTELINDLSDA